VKKAQATKEAQPVIEVKEKAKRVTLSEL
jgi:hypothetical protein